jgi:hypothetical protein
MANGYLGKISAIVSANTADFQSKINASAQDVGRFAKRVESDLNAASRQASRSLENIYTPLQKVERALKAANSMKLSFQGFKGAVRTVEELSQRLAELGKRQIDISVRGTGFKTAAQLHDAIRGISSKEVNLVASVGGLKEARELVASMQAADEYGKRRGVAFGKDASTGTVVRVRQTQLEEAVAKLVQFRDLDQIKIALKVVGTQQLDEATRKFKQMVSLGQEVTAPLEKIQSELSSFPADIQAAFQPTLIELQKRTERVSASIEKVGTTGRTFNRLAADVRGATQSVGFLSEAVAALGAINTRGLIDRTPAFKQALNANIAATKMRDSQPAFVTRNTDVGALDERRLDAVKRLIAVYAKLEAEESRGGASAKTNRQFEKQIVLVKQLTDSFNELVASTKGAAFDEIALQANRANAIFSSLSPQAARGLLGLQQQAAGLVDAYKLTGQGAAEAEAAVKRLAAASATAAGGDRLRGAADALGVGTPLSGVESAAAKAQAAFDALPESLRAKFQPELQRTLKEAAALGDTVAASGDKGDGAIERMISRLRGLQSSFQTTGGAADIGQTLASALSRVRVSQPLNLSEIARQATEAVGEFETLSAPIRRQLIPAFSEAINRAADLTKKIADGGRASAVEIAKVASAVGGLTERIKGAKDASALLNTGLFRNPGGSVGVDQLNQDVKALSDTFKTLPASSRAILLPFVEEVRGARTALREGAGSVRDYQAAVAALAAANRSTGATAGAFVSDSSAAGRARDVAEIEARINAASQASESFGRAGRRSLQELAEGARAASAAFAAGTGSIADARRAVDDLEASVAKTGRLEGISKLFRVGSEATKLRQLSDSAAALNDRFQALDITQRRALQGLAGSLRESLQAAEKAGTATPALKKDYEALLAAIAGSETATASIKSLEADLKALQGRLVGIRSNLDLTITGKFQNATQLGNAIEKLTADIEKLDAAGRTLFAGRIKLIIDAVDAGKLTEAQQDAKDLRADLDAAIVLKLDDDKADAKLKSLTAAVAKFREDAAFAITGRPQNMDQADSRLSQLRGDVGSMDAANRVSYAGLFEKAALAKEAGDLNSILVIIDQIEKNVQRDKEFKIRTDKAKAEADRLKATFDSLVDQGRQLATGLVQNRSQAESAVSSAMGRAANLDPARFAKIKQAMDDATASLSNGGFNPALIQQFTQLVDAEIEAKKKADDLTAAMRRIGDQTAPTELIDILNKRLEEARAAVAKLKGPLKEIGERNLEKIGAYARRNADNPAAVMNVAGAAEKLRDQAIAAAPPPKEPPAAKNALGEQLGTAARSIDNVQGRVISLQNEIEKLPLPLQAKMIPAINKVRSAFESLTPSSTKAEIDKVVAKAAALEKVLTRAQQASKLNVTLGEALNTAAFAKAEKQIGFMRSKLLELGAAANGPVAQAFSNYSAFIADASRKGTLGLAQTKRQADTLAQSLADAALKAGLFTSKTEAMAFVKNVGDVGRQGVDKWSLALNQAAFAVDDFLSSTGGLEFKLRAISNNITQLAFVLGGTTGLFIGLGTVIGGQVALGILKFVNNGRSAEDQTKALTDALSRQKSVVEDLAQSFRSLGDAVSRGTLSPTGERTADFDRQMQDIRRKQAEAVRNNAADLDPAVIKERAEQRKLQRQIEKSENPGAIVGFQSQLELSRKRERAAADRAVAAGAPNLDAVSEKLKEAFNRLADAAVADAALLSPEGGPQDEAGAPFRERAAGVRRAGSNQEAAAQLEQAIDELSKFTDAGVFGSGKEQASRKEIASLKSALDAIAVPILNEAANAVADASRGPAELIRQAQEEVAKAIEAGLPGARLFGLELDSVAAKLKEAYKQLEEASSGKDENQNTLSNEEKTRRVVAARAEIDALRAQQAGIESRSAVFRSQRIADPQRQLDARLSRAAGNLQAAGFEDGPLARQMRTIQDQREAIRQQAQKPEFQNPDAQQGREKQEAALNAEAAAIEAATIQLKAFADALNRATEEAKGNLNSAQQAADEARRADLAMSTPQTQEARRIADANLEKQRELERRVQTEAKADLERQAKIAASPEALRIRQIDEEMQSGSGAKREELIRERAQLQAKVDKAARESAAGLNAARDVSTTEAGRARMAERGAEMAKTPEQRFNEETRTGLASIGEYFKREANGGPVDAAGQRRAEQRYMEERNKEFRQQTSVGRGLDLGMTEQDRFARDIREGAAKDLGAAAKAMQAAGKPRAEVAAFLQRGIHNQMEQVAPMFKQFEDERRTAQLQGPSRAALQVSDVTTTGGASELTRLLRGDDSAKNENLAELRRQSDKLDEVVKAVRESAPGVL